MIPSMGMVRFDKYVQLASRNGLHIMQILIEKWDDIAEGNLWEICGEAGVRLPGTVALCKRHLSAPLLEGTCAPNRYVSCKMRRFV